MTRAELRVAAALDHITIERIDANRQRETVSLEAAGPGAHRRSTRGRDCRRFEVKDGDRIHVAPIFRTASE